MKINVEIDETLERLEVLIRAKEWDEDVNQLMNRLQEKRRSYFSGTNDETRHVFKPEEILYLYTEDKTVMARTEEGRYRMKERLYELEEELSKEQFVRLSKSAIANLDALHKFEASFNGTLCVYFRNGEKEYVSRRYVSDIKRKIEGKG
ncbi:LytTR family DNA-binding domain-containing protein [Salimicrobium flavidum]|uniref:Transcriptional regulator, LytTR family n=1 Tax=Salimicrobium flavidum TaxID=570947 RepID=A0A1N7INP1_9BACI|nr:LytTR family DNA-binding domain-containing protein [Salimicrobium flavidum]SIS38708.1 transcriptional regulator, LytTR family [Salimicrobium flavidum]